jgi:pimeloyl-CoA synthetase
MSERFKKLDAWFDFMNQQFEKIQDTYNTGVINNLLIDNDIETMEYRQITPDDELENECGYCKNPCDGSYCNSDCKKEDLK